MRRAVLGVMVAMLAIVLPATAGAAPPDRRDRPRGPGTGAVLKGTNQGEAVRRLAVDNGRQRIIMSVGGTH